MANKRRHLGHHLRDGRPKHRWLSQSEAELGMPSTQIAYPCGFCDGWHRSTAGKPSPKSSRERAFRRRVRRRAERWRDTLSGQ